MAEIYSTGQFSQLFRETRASKGVDGQVVTIDLGRIKPGRFRTLTHVTVENRDHKYDICRLGIKRGGRTHYLDELLDIAAAELAVSRSDILLGEGDVFFAELTGTTADNELVMTCVGWELVL